MLLCCFNPSLCDSDQLYGPHLFVNNTETQQGPAASQEAAMESTNSNSPLPPALPLTVSQPAIAPVVFVGTVGSAATVLLMDANKIVTQTPTLSAAASEASEITQLIVQPATSPGSMLQDIPTTDIRVVSTVDTTKVKQSADAALCLVFVKVNFPWNQMCHSIYRVLSDTN